MMRTIEGLTQVSVMMAALTLGLRGLASIVVCPRPQHGPCKYIRGERKREREREREREGEGGLRRKEPRDIQRKRERERKERERGERREIYMLLYRPRDRMCERVMLLKTRFSPISVKKPMNGSGVP
jgi:transposase